ncbi:MAG: NAD-dependent epimerase/dehydratase family protein, partial [Verrucomicrobiota bacterium]
MKILLTGSSGLLGNAYAEAALRRGHEVVGLYHRHPPAIDGLARTRSLPGTETDEWTTLCLEIWPDVIVNCAALSSPSAV